ncbi:MAG: GNAT family N-acetyltransferase [bacterium]|nr:GNAT family N-acetyltransferase [bacterium]
MNIIPLTKEYLDTTIRMVNECFPEDVSAEWSPERSFRTYLRMMEDDEFKKNNRIKGYNVWIVPEGNDVIAVTGLYRLQDDPEERVWLGWYCVREDRRGKHLGKELLLWTIERAKSMGFKKLRLYTTSSPGEERAQELYEKLDFKIVGQEKKSAYTTLYREKDLLK